MDQKYLGKEIEETLQELQKLSDDVTLYSEITLLARLLFSIFRSVGNFDKGSQVVTNNNIIVMAIVVVIGIAIFFVAEWTNSHIQNKSKTKVIKENQENRGFLIEEA